MSSISPVFFSIRLNYIRSWFFCYFFNYADPIISEGSKGITHYLGDKNRFDVSSEGPSSGISVGGRGKHACFYISEYIKTTRDKIKTNQMDLIKTRNK